MNKKKWFKKCITAVIVVLVCVGFSSCADKGKDLYVDNATEEPNDFDFSTKKAVEINLKYDVPAGYRVHFEMYTKSPLTLDEFKSYVKDTTLIPFLSGRCDENGKINFKGELPSSVNEIYVYSFGIGVPTLMKASVSATGTVSEFKTTEVQAAPASRATGNPSGTTSWKTYSVTLNKAPLPSVSMSISEEDKALIDKSFSINQNYDIVRTYYQPSIQFNDKARVKIYSVSNAANSNRINALAYYVFNSEEILPEDINSKLNLVFPELSKTTPAEGKGYQLLNNGEEIFEAGSHIGFALFPDITPGNIETDNTHVLYSSYKTGTWNVYTYPELSRASVPHMVLSVLRVDKDGHAIIAIGFEDQPWSTNHGTNKGDFRDAIFILEVDPASSLPEDLPTPPTDEPSYDAEYNSSGILCFEDSWPDKGDYDLNDVVIAYNRTICMKNNMIAALKETYTFLNNGATYVNGFGYQLTGVNRSNITKCTVESSYSFQQQGLDPTSEEATIMLFDKGKLVKAGTTFNVFTSFSDNTLIKNINPFLATASDYTGLTNILDPGRIEVHLATPKGAITKYLPTSKANNTLWGTRDDKSIPDNQIYYVRKGNYPFALELNWNSDVSGEVTNFVIPKEAESIENTYPKFTGWVESNGKDNTDWYFHPKK